MSSLEILAQIAGLLALIVLIASYFRKTKKNFLLLQIIFNLLFGVQYALLGDMTTAAICVVAFGRTILFFILNQKNDDIPVWALVLSEIAIVLCGIFTYAGPLSLIPVLNSCAYNYGAWQKDLKKTYLIGVVVATVWVFYNFLIGAYVGAFGSVLEVVAAAVGFYRLKSEKIEKKRSKRKIACQK